MNIFVLSPDPLQCAEYHCDKHIVKMITEHNQILGSISYVARGINAKKKITPDFILETFSGFPRKDPSGAPWPYGIGYKDHPCTKWTGRSRQNYLWLCELNLYMCREFTKRWGREHAGEQITHWYLQNQPSLPSLGLTPFAQAMPLSCKHPDAVVAYRNYYMRYKAHFARWAYSKRPWWFVNPLESNTLIPLTQDYEL